MKPPRKFHKRKVQLMMAAVVIVPLFVYVSIFVFSGGPIVTEHINLSVSRLLIPLAPVALIFTVSRTWQSFT